MAAGPQSSKEPRASKSARLPQVPIDRTLPVARALHELASPSTPQRIAQRLHQSPTAGTFRTVIGAAGYYGLIRQEGERRALTNLGERAIGDGDDAMAARREAVALTGYRTVLSAFRGREVNEGVIAARIQDDFGLAPTPAAQIARSLIEACEQTALISGGRFDAESIENALAAAPADARSGTSAVSDRSVAPKSLARSAAPGAPARESAAAATTPLSRHTAPALHIDIQLHIPATATPEQIDQIFASMAKHLYGRE